MKNRRIAKITVKHVYDNFFVSIFHEAGGHATTYLHEYNATLYDIGQYFRSAYACDVCLWLGNRRRVKSVTLEYPRDTPESVCTSA